MRPKENGNIFATQPVVFEDDCCRGSTKKEWQLVGANTHLTLGIAWVLRRVA